MSVDELAHRIDLEPRPILLDTRTREEFAIGHLPGAVQAGSSLEYEEGLREAIQSGRPIVTYCSIGYRSARVASRMAELGASNVFNLEGSIFLWANLGKPVVRAGREVKGVHPYSRLWSLLLRPDLRSWPNL